MDTAPSVVLLVLNVILVRGEAGTEELPSQSTTSEWGSVLEGIQTTHYAPLDNCACLETVTK